jgi:hypothetical protein
MGQFPGVVWLFDSVLHHLALGGFALWGKWAHYRELLSGAYGEIGPAIAHTVAGNWGTGDVFKRFDLIAELTRQQRGVIASWPALATRMESRVEGREIPTAQLPLVEPRREWETSWSPSEGPVTVVIVSLTSSNPGSAVAAAAGALDADAPTRVILCTSKPACLMGAAAAARRRGIEDHIDWVLDPGWVELADVARQADLAVWLDDDLRVGERLLILHGLAAGKPTIVPRSDIYDDLPEGAVAKVDLGRSLGPEVAAIVQALISDSELREGLREGARTFSSDSLTPAAAAQELRRVIEAQTETGGLEMVDLPAPILDAVRQDMVEHVVPPGAGRQTRRLLVEMLDELARFPGPRPKPVNRES